MINGLKRKSNELEKVIIDNEKSPIACGIRLEECGKSIAPKSVQALMIAHEENKLALYNANRNVKRLKTKVTQLQNRKSNLSAEINLKPKSEEIKMAVNNILDEKKLGSVIFISTEQYLSLVLSNPCSHCYNINLQNKTYYTSCAGFKITIDVECQLCGTIDSFSNQSKETNISHLIATATLAGGINRCAMQTALAVIGVTTQSCKQSFHQYQSQMFSNIILKANESAKQTLNAAIIHTNTKEKKVLSVGFDCSWSHSRNAGQASGEFIYLDDLEGK